MARPTHGALTKELLLGSHVTGTLLGAAAGSIGPIGVAPGARWIAAKGCRDGSCLNFGLLSSAQFMLCPTTRAGDRPRCDLSPDVINNSWGGGRGDTFYIAVANAWRAAGIVAVFSGGNGGPDCATASSPGDMETVMAVCAVDSNDQLATFSARGPGINRAGFAEQKPDFCAPGVAVLSAHSTIGMTDNSRYATNSGTSMAAPHLAGTLALLLSRQPGLGYNDLYQVCPFPNCFIFNAKINYLPRAVATTFHCSHAAPAPWNRTPGVCWQGE
jgi:subtilisin family serine protease